MTYSPISFLPGNPTLPNSGYETQIPITKPQVSIPSHKQKMLIAPSTKNWLDKIVPWALLSGAIIGGIWLIIRIAKSSSHSEERGNYIIKKNIENSSRQEEKDDDDDDL